MIHIWQHIWRPQPRRRMDPRRRLAPQRPPCFQVGLRVGIVHWFVSCQQLVQTGRPLIIPSLGLHLHAHMLVGIVKARHAHHRNRDDRKEKGRTIDHGGCVCSAQTFKVAMLQFSTFLGTTEKYWDGTIVGVHSYSFRASTRFIHSFNHWVIRSLGHLSF